MCGPGGNLGAGLFVGEDDVNLSKTSLQSREAERHFQRMSSGSTMPTTDPLDLRSWSGS